MSKLGTLGAKLYRGEVSYDFVGKRKLWFTVSLIVLAISIASLAIRGLTLGIEFRGGVEYTVNTKVTDSTVADFRQAVVDTNAEGLGDPIVTTVGSDQVRVQTRPLSQDDITKVKNAIAAEAGVQPTAISAQQIGASWGDQIARKALTALGIFLLLVFFVIWLYFREPKASAAAIIALLHDVVITIGVYALIGFDVTPATVIGVLTILGYSLYDTVVVFDKVRENTRGITASTRQTYSDATNLAVNQTIVRSVNTSVIALLPVASILVVGTVILGTGPLKDLSLALFVGIAAGAYSSIFIAPALLAMMKEREPAMQALARRVNARRTQAEAGPAPKVAVATAGAAGTTSEASGVTSEATGRAAKAATPNRPVKKSSAGRQQPSRKSRSKRRR